MKLFAEEDRVAGLNGVGVIDGYGAYIRELHRAWQVDPRYEFTPNFVHPTMLGHSAVAGEILRAMGAGLPLVGERRGSLQPDSRHAVALGAEPAFGVSRARRRASDPSDGSKSGAARGAQEISSQSSPERNSSRR